MGFVPKIHPIWQRDPLLRKMQLKYRIIQVAAFHWKVAPDYLVKKTQVRPLRRGLYLATPCHHSSARGK